MAEYIEREAVLEKLCSDCVDGCTRHCAEYTMLKYFPAADVRPVVLCRDCKHSEPWYSDKLRCFLWNERGIDVFNDGFCNYGERRKES